MMRVVVIVLLGVHLAYAGTHSLKYFYTGASGDIDFPEFTAVGLVDDGQFMYFDSNIMKAVPKTEWIRQNEGADYWDRETQVLIGSRQVFKDNIQIAKERFNQSKGKHSLQYFYTATSGLPNFPQFVTVGIVDGQPFTYYDSKIRRETPRQEWMAKSVEEDYWERNTQISIGTEQAFMNNINVAKDRFNQTGGVHSLQWMYGCELDDDGTKRGYMQYGYDGEDFLTLDKSTLTWTAAVPQAINTKIKWDSTGAEANVQSIYLENTCIEWLNKYVDYGKDTLKRKVSPQVSLLQKDPSSPVTCHATGFYPSGVTISWQRNGHDHHEDVDLGELLPNEDGTFQKSSTIRVTPDEWKKNEFSCVVEHQGKTVTEKKIRTNNDPTETSVPIAMIVGAVAAVILLVVIGAVGFMVYQIKKGCFSGFKPVKPSDDSSSQRSTNSLMSSGSGSSTSS